MRKLSTEKYCATRWGTNSVTVRDQDIEELARLRLRAEYSFDEVRSAALTDFMIKYLRLFAGKRENKAFIDANLPGMIEKMRPEVGEQYRKEAEDAELTKLAREREETALALERALVEADEDASKIAKELDFENLAKKAFPNTPVEWLRQVGYRPEYSWDADERTDRKAYIFACFSEIAYLQYTKFDLPGEGRYKVVPSEALENLRTHNMRFDLAAVVQAVTGGEGLTVTISNPGRGFVYATFVTPKFIVIAVRGTSTLSELLLIDFNSLKVGGGNDRYHSGFYKEAMTAMSELKKQSALVTAEGVNGIPVYFTGHSMGGAVSWIFRHIWGNSHRVMTPYIYASPRIGNSAVARKYPVYAYTRANDAVPHLPPLSWHFEDAVGATTVNAEEEKMSKIALWAKFWKIRKNHSIERYRKELGEKTGDPQFSPDVYFTALFAEMIDVYRVLGHPYPYGIQTNDPAGA